MNVEEAQTAQSPDAASAAPDVDQRPEQKAEGPTAFSKLLSKNAKNKQDGADISAHVSEKSISQPLDAVTQPVAEPRGLTTAASKAEAVHSVAIPREIEGVVREITAGVNQAGRSEVNIQLNSKTLAGLQIHIEKRDGRIDIQFQSRTDDVARLLSRNTGELSQALADRGVVVNDIRVESPQTIAHSSEFKPQSRQQQSGRDGQGRGGNGGRQQQSRQ